MALSFQINKCHKSLNKKNQKIMVFEKQKPVKKDSSRPIYYKTFAAKDVAIDAENRVIKFYAAIWGNKDDAGDILIKGCFAKSIQERGPESSTNRKILFLWMHEIDEPLGKPTVLKEDNIGLYVETPVDRIPEGDRCLEQLKSGTLNQFSIGYQYVWDKMEYDETQDAFIVKEVNLFEVSVVSFGCNEETEFLGMKAEQLESQRNQLLRETDKALKTLPYETQIQIRQLISKHISLAEAEPGKPLKHNEPGPAKAIDFSPLIN